ncbi:glycosyltransferase [Collinsella sp. An2]|uniref:glycosyltransferase n=1 Tax=Collinsella sp. An2 TaxID=1965585 RepID=UPI000B376F9F|nr:glycosyltransferase [Collinsella sp. An2]OUP08698.1 hypothetical protein B5F33_06695 [Collinsella sp. An2]
MDEMVTTATDAAPKVSIIVPVYNAEAHLERCIASILAQDIDDFELILVDDGSTDASGTICDIAARDDERVRVIHQDNAGVSVARNVALDIARGTYLQFVDADDWIVAEASRLMVRAAEETGADMVITDFFRIVDKLASRKGDIDLDRTITPEEYADFMIENPADYYYGVLWNKLFRRDVVEQHHLRMDPELSWCEDFIFNMEYIVHTHRIYPLRVPVYYYVKTKGSLVNKSLSMANIVRMKLSVVEYYDDFFRRLYDEADYEARRGEIRGFLFTYPHDDSAIGVLPSTKKLGRERVRAQVTPGTERHPLGPLYFIQKAWLRSLQAVADRFDLELRDVQVLAYLHFAGGMAGLSELVDFLDVPTVTLAPTIAGLAAKQIVKVGPNVSAVFDRVAEADDESKVAQVLRSLSDKLDLGPKGAHAAETRLRESRGDGEDTIPLATIRLYKMPRHLTDALDRAADDVRERCFKGLSATEQKQAEALFKRVGDNARRLFGES